VDIAIDNANIVTLLPGGGGGGEGDMKDGERRKRGVKTVQQLLIMLQYLKLIQNKKL
jgi:hypothetical protein